MPGKRQKRSRKGGKPNAFHNAPKQGIGSTEDWVINDIQPVVLPTGTSTSTLTVRLSADANGFAWNIGDSGTLVAQYPSAAYFQNFESFGYANNQFQRLAQLWEQYRIDWIEVEYMPSGQVQGISATAMFSCIDEADLIGGAAGIGDLIPRFASQRTTDMHTPYTVCKRRLNFAKYLGQGQDRAWLQTIDPAVAPLLQRELYVTNQTSGSSTTARTPAIAMVFGLNIGAFGGPTTTAPLLVGSLRLRAKYSFRQRAALKDDPVLNANTLIGYDTQSNGELRSVRIPMDRIPQRCLIEDCETTGATADSDNPSLEMTTSTMQALKSALTAKGLM